MRLPTIGARRSLRRERQPENGRRREILLPFVAAGLTCPDIWETDVAAALRPTDSGISLRSIRLRPSPLPFQSGDPRVGGKGVAVQIDNHPREFADKPRAACVERDMP